MFASGQNEALESLINLSVNRTRVINASEIPKGLKSIVPQNPSELKRKTYSDIASENKKLKTDTEIKPEYQTLNDLTVPEVQQRPGGNWQCWSHEEEVFLVGAVLDRFFARGSLSSTKKETTQGNKKNCWDSIKKTYDTCFYKYSNSIGVECPPTRTENALSRHYKVMKERCIGKGTKNQIDFKALYDEWEEKYNKKYNLIPEPQYDTPATKKKRGAMGHDFLNGPSQSKGRWNFHDEVILIGVVVETFFQRGSLSSSHRERKKHESDFWENLHQQYEAVRHRYNQVYGHGVVKTSRSHQALARHFKVMKVKLIDSNGALNLKSFYHEWELTYRKFYLQILKENNHSEKKIKVEQPSSFSMQQFHKNMRSKELERKEQELESQFLPQKATLRNVPSNPNPMLLANLRSASQQSLPANSMENTVVHPQFTLPRTSSFSSLFASTIQPQQQSPAAIINLDMIKNLQQNGIELPQAEMFRNILTPRSEGIDLTKPEFMPLISPGATPTPSEAGGPNGMPTPVLTHSGNATTMWIPITVMTPQSMVAPRSPGPAPTQDFSNET